MLAHTSAHLYDARVWKASCECLILFVESLAHGQYEVMYSLLLSPGHGIRQALPGPYLAAGLGESKNLTSLLLASPTKVPISPE